MVMSPSASTKRVPPETLDALVAVLNAVRRGRASTRPEIMEITGLGRAVVVQRVAELLDRGLLIEAGLGRSSGGRAPRVLRFAASAGHTIVADVGASSVAVGIADLSGRLLAHHEEAADVARGPELMLGRVEQLATDAQADLTAEAGPLWGVGIGIPGPLEFSTGRPISPPIMPGWDRYPIRERFSKRFGVPVWVDNDANLMALGEYRAGALRGAPDSVFIKVGTGIGAGLLLGGRLHRGAMGSAGDVGHAQISDHVTVACRCGNVGCVEAQAGGSAIGRDGTAAARDGRSPALAQVLAERGQVLAVDVGNAAAHGDPVSLEILTSAGHLLGRMIANLVNAVNPSVVAVGGGVMRSGDATMAAIRQSVYARSLPLATRSLQIVRSDLDESAGLIGAAHMVVDELLIRPRLAAWMEAGSPSGLVELPELPTPTPVV